jgi:hypothetical protein
MRSKSAGLIYPESSADSRRVRPVRSASWAIAEALSYPITHAPSIDEAVASSRNDRRVVVN